MVLASSVTGRPRHRERTAAPPAQASVSLGDSGLDQQAYRMVCPRYRSSNDTSLVAPGQLERAGAIAAAGGGKPRLGSAGRANVAFLSLNAEGDEVPAASAGPGREATEILIEAGRFTAARLRAEQPAGAVFALGWVMAELFDPRRRASVTVRQPPFDPDVQLPQVADLAADPKLVFLAAELAEYLHWYPAPGRRRCARSRPRPEEEGGRSRGRTRPSAEAAARAGRPGQPDDVAEAEAAAAAVAARPPFSERRLPRRGGGAEPGHPR